MSEDNFCSELDQKIEQLTDIVDSLCTQIQPLKIRIEKLTEQHKQHEKEFEEYKAQLPDYQLSRDLCNARELIVNEVLSLNAQACREWTEEYDDTKYITDMNALMAKLETLGLKKPFPVFFKIRDHKYGCNESLPISLTRLDFTFDNVIRML